MSGEVSSEEVKALVDMLARAMRLTVQAVNQSTALAAVLIAKGFVTQAELDEEMKKVEPATKKLVDSILRYRDEIQ